MTKRLNIIYSELVTCNTFADIGCDHGYIVKAMLDGKKCEFSYASEISKNCLEKAEKLLDNYVKTGKASCVVGDGFSSIPYCDQALIAGMGGEEIIKILLESKFLPDRLVLQPMKNVDKVRVYLVQNGYKIVKDYLFCDKNKYYDLIVLEKGVDRLTEDEINFGRTNLETNNPILVKRITEEINLLENCVLSDRLNEENKKNLIEKIKGLKKYV